MWHLKSHRGVTCTIFQTSNVNECVISTAAFCHRCQHPWVWRVAKWPWLTSMKEGVATICGFSVAQILSVSRVLIGWHGAKGWTSIFSKWSAATPLPRCIWTLTLFSSLLWRTLPSKDIDHSVTTSSSEQSPLTSHGHPRATLVLR